MTIIEQIKTEIERLKNKMDDRDPLALNQKAGYLFALEDVLSFIDTLESEKQINQEELDQEIIKCWQEWVSPSNKQSVEGVLPLSEFAFYARHFAKWGAELQKEQDDRLVDIIYQQGIEKGKDEMRETLKRKEKNERNTTSGI